MTQTRMDNLINLHVHKEQTLSTWKQSRTSSLQETNDEGACLESFNFSCVVSKLNVYLKMT